MKLARVALSALFLGGIACSSIQTVRNPAQFFATHPDLVVVTYNDNSEVPIAHPQMRGDSVVGWWLGMADEPVAVAMSDVQRMDAVQKDSKMTTLFVASLVGLSAVTAYGLSRATNNDGVICDFFRGGSPNGADIINDIGACYRSR